MLGRPGCPQTNRRMRCWVMVLTDLAAICKKLGENSAVPEELRVKARHFVQEFNLLEPYRGKGNAYQHFEGEKLLEKMALLLPRLLEVQAQPAIASGE